MMTHNTLPAFSSGFHPCEESTITEKNIASSIFWARAMALLIDLALLGSLHVSAFLLLGRQLFQGMPYPPLVICNISLTYGMFFLVLPPLETMFYFTTLHAFGGQSLGKFIMGLRVVTMSGEPLTVGAAFLRWVGYIVSLLPLGAGFLWVVLDKKHCAWHDKLAGTRVISTREIS